MDVVEEAWAAERDLLRPDVRGDAARLRELLAESFVEFGQSGRRWTRAEIVDALTNDEQDPAFDEASLEEQDARLLAPHTVLLTYLLDVGGRRSRRSSVWVDHGGRLKCVFHQGTTVRIGDPKI